MKFRSIVEIVRAKGQKETLTQELDQDRIVLGRGGSSDILYDSTLISLEHAAFSFQNGKLVIEDLDSLSGVRVNGRAVRRQELKAKDRIILGDTELRVTQEGDSWQIFEERSEAVGEDSNDRAKRYLESLNVTNALPSMTLLSSLFVIIIIALFLFIPLSGALNGVSEMTWSSGPISNAHKMIENNCEACHADPFTQIQDDTCLSCHKMTVHAEAFSTGDIAAAHSEMRCAQCHMEHNGDSGVTLSESSLCTDCHDGLSSVFPDTELLDVPHFQSHPEYAVTLAKFGGEDGETERVRLDDTHNLKDGARFKLNHKVHLEAGIAGPEGPTTLQCDDCHRLTPTTKIFEPVQYESDCSRCHGLEFDDRLPGNEVPHGDAETVYNYAYAEYAKLFLRQDDAPPVPGFERFKPGKAPKKREDKREFVENEVDRAARDAEELLFEKTACHLCHQISKKSESEFEADGSNSGRYKVRRPNIPVVWMPKANFDHSAHQEIKCASCHEGVTDSEETTDVLMPNVKSCQSCHADNGKIGKIHSDCIMCHSYHDQEVLPEVKKQEIHEIVSMIHGES